MERVREALALLGRGRSLTAEGAHAAIGEIMGGQVPEPLIAGLLAAWHVRGETDEELAGAVRAARERMEPFEGDFPPLLDTCGTGGDGASTLNVSTAAALVVSCCGVAVAKHGNRSASGNSGSAEVLAELGVSIEADPALLRRGLREYSIAFLFAPRFHPAARHAAPVRKLLPFRTIFNLIGPLANPARPAYQLIGVPDVELAGRLARALARLGVARAAVVAGADGLDEVSISGPTEAFWIEAVAIHRETWTPEDFGISATPAPDIRVSGPADSARRIRAILDGQAGPARDVVLANSAAALRVAGRVDSLREGVGLAASAIDSGEALRKLEAWAKLTNGVGPA
ncbi:MAG: anthranilate phosphoribosyltransferase [Isosphaeraceae bacterium]